MPTKDICRTEIPVNNPDLLFTPTKSSGLGDKVQSTSPAVQSDPEGRRDTKKRKTSSLQNPTPAAESALSTPLVLPEQRGVAADEVQNADLRRATIIAAEVALEETRRGLAAERRFREQRLDSDRRDAEDLATIKARCLLLFETECEAE